MVAGWDGIAPRGGGLHRSWSSRHCCVCRWVWCGLSPRPTRRLDDRPLIRSAAHRRAGRARTGADPGHQHSHESRHAGRGTVVTRRRDGAAGQHGSRHDAAAGTDASPHSRAQPDPQGQPEPAGQGPRASRHQADHNDVSGAATFAERLRGHFGHRDHLYGVLLDDMARDYERGGVTRDLFAGWTEAEPRQMPQRRLLAGLFRIVLRGDAPQLVPYYPVLTASGPPPGAWSLGRAGPPRRPSPLRRGQVGDGPRGLPARDPGVWRCRVASRGLGARVPPRVRHLPGGPPPRMPGPLCAPSSGRGCWSDTPVSTAPSRWLGP